MLSSDDTKKPEYYSVALIGSSGGGTATLGHTDPIEVLTTIHRELLNLTDPSDDNRRVCIGLSHAIFVSLSDGSGFDSVRSENEWIPDGFDDGMGPMAALYAVGFNALAITEEDIADASDIPFVANETQQCNPFEVTLVGEGPLTKINRLALTLDMMLAHAIHKSHNGDEDEEEEEEEEEEDLNNRKKKDYKVKAMISLSSEPTTIHSASLQICARLFNFPIVGSGGSSLSQIASLYDLRIVGNSGGSVASTTVTKAKGWARGLAAEWGMQYDGSIVEQQTSTVSSEIDAKQGDRNNATTTPTLKSILEAALPSFLFVSIALHLLNIWENNDNTTTCVLDQDENESINLNTPMSIIRYALQYIVIGTTCCVLAATSTANKSDDQSTLLMSATIAGVLTSASASQSVYHDTLSLPNTIGGGSALAGLIAGAYTTKVMKVVSNICHRCHITATMTNILCGGGVGMMVGVAMHASGLAHGFGLITGAIRCIIRWRKVIVHASMSGSIQLSLDTVPLMLPHGLMNWVFPILQHIQNQWCELASTPSLSILFYEASANLVQNDSNCMIAQSLPIPIGLGFLCGCIFVYGSKIGWYHSLFLPLILIEMDAANIHEEASLLGAIDECTLALVCAGICAGNLLLPPFTARDGKTNGSKGSGQASLAWQALKTNLFCGDFIEAAYPSMERSKLINRSAYVAAGMSTEILLKRRVLSTAYLPLPLAIWISNNRLFMGIACFIAFAVSFMGTIISNTISYF